MRDKIYVIDSLKALVDSEAPDSVKGAALGCWGALLGGQMLRSENQVDRISALAYKAGDASWTRLAHQTVSKVRGYFAEMEFPEPDGFEPISLSVYGPHP